jgi:protein MAK11
MTLLHTIQHSSRIHDVKFCDHVLNEAEVLLVGAEDKKVSVYNISDDSSRPPFIIAQMVDHCNRYYLWLPVFHQLNRVSCRVKAIQTLKIALPPASGRPTTTIVASVSSDGKIRVFDLDSIPVTSAEVIEIKAAAEYDTKGTRLTCVTIADGDVPEHQVSNGKRKREGFENSEDDVFAEVTSDGKENEDEEDEGELEKEDED